MNRVGETTTPRFLFEPGLPRGGREMRLSVRLCEMGDHTSALRQYRRLFKKENQENADRAGGATAMIVGLLTLGVQYWAGPTHVFNGVNYADAFHGALLVFGLGWLIFGASILIISLVAKSSPEPSPQRTRP